MSAQLSTKNKAIRVAAAAAICGLSFSFIVGEAVQSKSFLITKWQRDSRLFPAEILALRPLRAASMALASKDWRDRLYIANAAPGTPYPNYVMLPETILADDLPASDEVKLAAAAPAPVAAPTAAATVRIPRALPSDVKSAPAIEARKPASTPFTQLAEAVLPQAKAEAAPALAGSPVAVPPTITSVSNLIARGDIENIITSMNEVSDRVHSSPLKVQSKLALASAIVGSSREKVMPSAPEMVAIASDKGTEHLMVIQGDTSQPEEIVATKIASVAAEDQAPAGPNWKIQGRIAAPTNMPKGHFEIGLFSKIDQDGIPIGFPLVQQILPAGIHKFELKVPGKLEKGFLYGEFVAAKTGKRSWIAPPVNPWLRNERQVAELTFQEEDSVTTVAAAGVATSAQNEGLKISGTVGTLFAKTGSPIPQEDVLVKVRGRKEATRTGKDGSFRLDLPSVKGAINLEFMKAGYHPSVVEVPVTNNGMEVKVELASREAVDQVARMLGLRQITAKGVFLGKAINADGTGLKGLNVRSSVKAEGPFYFGEDGFPVAGRKTTSADGRFIYFNLEAGTGYMEASQGGEAIAPFQFSTVDGGEMVMKELLPESGNIKGRIFNPVASNNRLQPLAGARLRIEGGADFAVTDSYGAFTIGPVKWMRGERIFLEMSAEKFNNHRYSIIPGKTKAAQNLYAFPALYLSRLAQSMDVDLDPYAGLVMGKVTGSAVRIDALADHSPVNGAKDFYFDAKGKLRGSHTMTDPKFGTYVIFNVPKGRTLLQGNDSGGLLRYSEAVVASPSSVSVIME